MPTTVSPGGPPSQHPALVMIGPEEIAPGVSVYIEHITNDLYGFAYAFYFNTGVVSLTWDQLRAVKEHIAPALKHRGCVAEFYGLADRTGSQKTNYRVSHERLVNFQLACLGSGGPPNMVFGPQHKYFGEDFVASLGEKDETKNQFTRCVFALLWPNQQASRRVLQDLSIVEYGRTHPQP